MRVGQILLKHGWVEQDRLVRALTQQPRIKLRLCSLLVARGAVEFDQAARALAEQHGAPAALMRHLERRDRALVGLLPAGIARSNVALPIGRARDGSLIICVRDPTPALHESLTYITGDTIMLVVTPARHLERLVDVAYSGADRADPDLHDLDHELEPEAEPELDIDVDTEPEPAGTVEIDFDAAPASEDAGGSGASFEIDLADPDEDPREDAGPNVVAHDDAPEPAVTRPVSTALPVEIRPIAVAPSNAPDPHSVEGLIASLADIDDVDWMFDAVMSHVETHWNAAVLFAIRDGTAIGVRGHGPALANHEIKAFRLPLTMPSIVQLAHEQRRLQQQSPPTASPVESKLVDKLGAPEHLIAAPLSLRDEVEHVLVVGDPRSEDPDDLAVDLARLVEAIDEALARMGAGASP